MKLKVHGLCPQVQPLSLGNQMNRPHGGLATPPPFVSTSITNEQSIKSSPSASNYFDTEFESLITGVCSTELHTPEINIKNLINDDNYSIDLDNLEDMGPDDENLVTSTCPLSPAFYSGNFSSGCYDYSIDQALEELDSIITTSNRYHQNEKPEQTDHFDSVDKDQWSTGSMSSVYTGFNSPNEPMLSYVDPTSKDLMPRHTQEILDDPGFDFALNSMDLGSDESFTSLNSIFDITSLDMSDINSSLAIPDENFNLEEYNDAQDLNFDGMVNSFLMEDSLPSFSATEYVKDTQDQHKPIPIPSKNDQIIKAFVSNYGDQSKPLVLGKVKIITPKIENLSPCSVNEINTLVNSTDNVETASNITIIDISSDDTNVPHSSKRTQRKTRLPSKYVQNEISCSEDEDRPASRPKRTKMSLENLSDADKYLRIRAQNNVASKKCREKKKQKIEEMRQKCEFEEHRNTQLIKEGERLEARKRQWKRLFSLKLLS